jgi:hypothetical protein
MHTDHIVIERLYFEQIKQLTRRTLGLRPAERPVSLRLTRFPYRPASPLRLRVWR